ncbi:CBM35 domain-containing protein [Streptomyces sp. NBC_01565]|uniref:CBM35 domain-containing protein n=1 Tax=Streptomyces sp. NBC_01565 TaxID=2975881 RepID=UPI0022571743|nr:CBM35 domain-containing protein [Streptomyces sp. NBC_01565]MCX4542892.1 carbohydrate-binding protein [Streptomyces sp. NBC_01565]
MTTPANNGPHGGANKPEDDDPFGYLYADGQAAGATPPTSGGYGYPGQTVGGQPGVPRTSYNQVRTVGERTYGGQRGPVPHQQGPQPQQPGYQAQYQAPEALQAGGYGVPPQQQAPPPQAPAPRGGRGGGGSSRRGMLIAAVAVVAAVAIGIGAAVAFGDKDGDKAKGGKDQANGQQQSASPKKSDDTKPSSSPAASQAPLPKADASGSGMTLTGNAVLQNAVQGAKSAGGQYVGNFNQQGAALTWTADIPADGKYTLFVNYAVPGKDAKATLTVNGQNPTQSLNLANFSKAEAGAWDKGWTRTFAWINLKKGSNTMKISCEAGDQCDVIFDQLDLGAGHRR